MKKVLVIEDNRDIRENIVEILELTGYELYQADNGMKGIELALTCLPDIILCDIMMPELDGYSVLHMLQKHTQTSAIPFVFLTAKAEHTDQRKGMDMGADDYLTKPFNRLELLNSIERRLSKKEAQQHIYSHALDQLSSLVIKKDGLQELKVLVNERKVRPFKKGQVVYYEGDPGSDLYLVVSGKIKTFKQAAESHDLITGFYKADDYLGINASLAGEPYIDTAVAMESSTLCLIPAAILNKLINEYPELGRAFIKLLSNDIREKEEQLVHLAYSSVRKKLAAIIVRLQRQLPVESSDIKITREDLAAVAGMATETVSRTLSDFIQEGIIAKDGNVITILNLQRLALMKN
jgi:CRP-like cAMP-binding protein/CheY-like chemotaxis protein